MTRLPGRFVGVALAVSIVLSPVWGFGQEASPAQPPAPAEQPAAPAEQPVAPPAPAEPAPAQAAPATDPNAELTAAVENFWHYGKIARYDLAKAEADKILAQKDNPVPILLAFEKVAAERKDNLDQWLLRWQGTEQLQEVTGQIITTLNDGRRTRRADPAAIEANVKRLTSTGRGYYLAVQQLRESGELAVPVLIDYLRDPGKSEYHDAVRSALKDLGRLSLNPLVAVTETRNQDLLIPVVTVLGDIGYGAAMPYLAKVAGDAGVSAESRAAAVASLQKMGASGAINAPQLFYEVAEKFYYDNADIAADKRDPANPANVWFWDESKGLTRIQVPQQIFNEIMSMRSCEYSLKLGQAGGDALSLWLAANYKREVELPEGQKDGTRAEAQPSAHFYGVDSGAQYLNSALARALRDRNAQVALRIIKSLQEIVGKTNLFSGEGGTGAPALIDAMASSDRSVRFEAAFAVAAAMPTQAFQGQDRVVPLLAEALSQTGVPSVLVVMADYNRANQVVTDLRNAGYAAVGGVGPQAAVTAANQLPAIDVILISEEVGAAQVDQMLAIAAQNARLAGSAKVVIVRSGASPYTARAATDSMLSTTPASDSEGLKSAIDAARSKSTAVPIDQAGASSYALRAADLLQKLAMTGTTVFDLSAAEQTVLNALNDQRPDVVKASGNVLGWLDSQPGQGALLTAVLNEKTGDDVKVSLLKSLATSAKNHGNRLNAQQVQALDQLVESATNQDVKNGAGEARGALNLPADQAKSLIVKQSRV